MTFRILGLPDELRLDFEEATGIKTETAQLIVEESVQEAERRMSNAIREVQEVIGPHGSVTRLQAGGIRILPGTGIGVYEDGVLKTTILPDGNFRVGSDINDPATTTFCAFVNDQIYNNETMGAGDLLIGDNSAGNVKYDASEGQLQFRNGTTVKAYMATDGSIKAGGGDVTLDDWGVTFANQEGNLTFTDTAGNVNTILIYSGADDFLILKNAVGAKGISFAVDDAGHNVKQIDFTTDGIIFQRGMELDLEGGSTPLSMGWFPKSETWTRTGNHQFTVSGDLTAVYRKYAKVKYKDGGGFEYGVIASSSYSSPNTTVNLIPNSDYAMAAATITENYISYIENPEGFPDQFNYTPAWTSDGTQPALGNGTLTGTWFAEKGKLHVDVALHTGSSSTYGTSTYRISLPVSAGAGDGSLGSCLLLDISTVTYYAGVSKVDGSTIIFIVVTSIVQATAPFTFASGDYIWASIDAHI